MKKCEYCGLEAHEGSLFCRGCGTPFPAAACGADAEGPVLIHAHETAVATTPGGLPVAPEDVLAPTGCLASKKCGYCGRSNQNDALCCGECGTPFETQSASPGPSLLTGPLGWDRNAESYTWSAADAWKCLGMMFVFFTVVGLCMLALSTRVAPLRHWNRTAAGFFLEYFLQNSILVLTPLYFARTTSLAAFNKEIGLQTPPSSYVWFAVCIALLLVGGSHILISSGTTTGVKNPAIHGFLRTVGAGRYLYLAPIFLAPFCEEICLRGFIYRAFRGSYSALASGVLVVGITALAHIDQLMQSSAAVLAITGVTILQCFLRERTGSLWDCIITHLVFNSAGLFSAFLVK